MHKPTIRHFVVHLFLAITTLVGSSACGEDSLETKVDRLVEPYIKNEILVGVSVGIIQNGETSSFGYGKTKIQDGKVPDDHTIYEIGSMTKVFTGILLAEAVARGEVRLDERAEALLPEDVTMPKFDDKEITLMQLSTHSSGLPRVPKNMVFKRLDNPYLDYTVDEMYAFLNDYKLPRAPGSKFEYSNLGQGLLGHLLALQEKKSYEALVRDRITAPLLMKNTSIALSASQKANLAAPHRADGTPDSNWDIPTLAGAGAIRSDVYDMLLFGKAMLHPPEGKLGEAIDLAWELHQEPLAIDDFAMGLGWHFARDGKTRWHNGQTGGYHSITMASRKYNTYVVLLSNTATQELDLLGNDLFRMISGEDIKPRKFEPIVEIPIEKIKRYVGKYSLAPEFVFTVTLEDKKLMVQITGQPALRVFPKSETEWDYRIVPATITFQVDENDKCPSLELFQNGIRQKATRTE